MSISVDGIISGMDTGNIISQLLDLAKKPILALQQKEAGYQVDLSIYGGLKGVLNSLKTTTLGLDSTIDFTSLSASSGDSDIFTVSADSTATAGSHNISVEQLAQVHKLKSTAFSTTEEVMVFSVSANNKYIDFKENGGAELTATLTEGNYTVSELETEIKSQLEAASGNNIDYTVTYDSSTKKFTIEEDGSSLTQLDVLWATGTNNANNATSLLGFASTDDTGAFEYTSDNEVGEGTIHLEIGTTFTIDSTNNKIDFLEVGALGTERNATLTSGTYTIGELETEIKNKLESENGSDATYTVSYDNSTQKFNISVSGGSVTELQFLWATGANTSTSSATTIGFSNAANDTGLLSYTADNEVGTVHDISISATDTIEDVADAINDADTGVQAAVIFDGTNNFLTLSAKDTGQNNVINLSVTDIDGNHTDTNSLSRLVYHEGGTTNLTETQNALDSIIYVDGVTNIHRTGNIVDDVIEGVTITLKDVHADPATESDSLTVTRNTSAIVSKINSFVSAYNNVLSFFETYQGYDEATETSGVLQGDSTTNQIRNRLSKLINQELSGVETFSRLSDLGIRLSSEGELQTDSSTLNNALDDNFDDVLQFFTQTTVGSEGFGVRMVDVLEDVLDSNDGILTARTSGIQNSIDDIQDKVERLTKKLETTEISMRAQFNSLELLLSQYQTTGSYLTQQLSSLQNLNTYISNK